jgi:hypothetical protein
MHVGGVVVLSGPAAQLALDATRIARAYRRDRGLPIDRLTVLADTLHAAASATGHPETVAVQRSFMSIPEAAELLGLSHRQTQRLAPKLDGQRVGGRWLVDRLAVLEHREGMQEWEVPPNE